MALGNCLHGQNFSPLITEGTQSFIITYKGIFSYIKEYVYTHCACMGIYILLYICITARM